MKRFLLTSKARQIQELNRRRLAGELTEEEHKAELTALLGEEPELPMFATLGIGAATEAPVMR